MARAPQKPKRSEQADKAPVSSPMEPLRTAKSKAGSKARQTTASAVVMGLNAAIVAVWDETPHVLIVSHDGEAVSRPDRGLDGLPFGPFEPLKHRTMEIGLRRWVEAQTALKLGYVEQLYTFADRGRHATAEGEEPHMVSVGYLALTRRSPMPAGAGAVWNSWYHYFPWEDRRKTTPGIIRALIEPLLDDWAARADDPQQRVQRRQRAHLCFGRNALPWNEEQVLDRYELLYEAGLVYEAHRDRPELHGGAPGRLVTAGAPAEGLGTPMIYDHRRILATAMGRLRAKLKYRPVVFELMAPAFTLFELQRTVEAISGVRLHKQNFRRLLARTGLVEPTGEVTTKTGGRPAEQYRFRREVVRERQAPGLRLAPQRARSPA